MRRDALRGFALLLTIAPVGCGPALIEGAVEDDAGPRVDAVPRDAGAPAPRDVPAMDAPAAPRDIPATDLGTAPDRVAPSDIVAPTDLPAAIDVPAAPRDAGPIDVGCPLPPPIARPPAALPSGEAVVRAVAAEHPDWLLGSCLAMGGSSAFLHEVLRRGRAVDPRWGLDRRLGPVSGDIVTYFYGDGCPEGRREVYMVDIIVRHCARPGVDAPPEPGWIDRTAEGGMWTLQGYDGTSPPDAGVVPRDVPPARAPLPDASGVVNALARERADLLARSCVDMGGDNEFLFELVRRLRRTDRRWGLNWKRGRVGDMSQDVVNYFWGPAGAAMEGSPDTYVIDVIGGHCGPTPSPAWIDVTGVGGALALWTLAGRTDL